MDQNSLLKQLTDIGPRFAQKEMQAAEIIKRYLETHNIQYVIQQFDTEVPVCTKAELTVDGQPMDCVGSSIVSGEIPDAKYVISHFGYSGKTPYNLAYNPLTDTLSLVDHFRVPSLTVSRKDVIRLVMAKEVKGLVEVERTKIKSENILVGNLKKPKYIVFAHYDSIVGQGAVDNAGSVITMMNCILNNPPLLSSTLFNFSGNEEIAYDDYNLCGYGFRVFEDACGLQMLHAEKIIVLDGVGIGDPTLAQDGLGWVLQVKMLNDIKNKVFWMQNDQTQTLSKFHSLDDNIEIIDEKYLTVAEELLVKTLQ